MSAVFAVCLGALGLSSAAAARAQVLEIGSTGEVKVYNGPTLFTADGAMPILRPRATARRAPPPVGPGPEMARAAQAAALSPELVSAVAWRESNYRTDRVSHAGAVGEMQLMPATARAMGIDPADAAQNLSGGASYLRAMMQRYDGDLMRALAAYDAGPGAVDRYGGVPPFKETQAYVAAIMDRLSKVAEATTASGVAR
ncbi:lytic transglycosylase domain-containing protein [Caulobacter sp. S45]|uniref:lytic transglycosylase domain-containing protein n=1 Tax=Caulobacter sp. S45 TaxID=1641861 RepID=UPI0015758207|nr:lytic transglycosylase domain-containing protein [Caulobacter sp. S45]